MWLWGHKKPLANTIIRGRIVMEDMIVLEVFGKSGLIETIELELGDYYDGDVYDELTAKGNVVLKGITSVKGTQYGSKGKPYHIMDSLF